MSSQGESFLDRLSISPAEDDLVAVTVYLPPDLVHDYRRFLESVSTFFLNVERKASAEAVEARAVKRQAIEYHGQQNLILYHERISKSFDDYTLAGLDRKAAVRRVAADLRADKHPWCCPELVKRELVKLGRGGQAGRPPRVRS